MRASNAQLSSAAQSHLDVEHMQNCWAYRRELICLASPIHEGHLACGGQFCRRIPNLSKLSCIWGGALWWTVGLDIIATP